MGAVGTQPGPRRRCPNRPAAPPVPRLSQPQRPVNERSVPTMKRAHYRLSAVYILATAILVGCGGGGGGGLPDPGLSNVQVEVGNARSALIGPGGGTITATGSNGFVYTLTIPAGSIL